MRFAEIEATPAVERSQDLRGSDLYGLWPSRLLVAVALIVQIFVAWRFWAITWDDSAITLGFARTFAHTGRIEPTPGSGIVEGYSTTLWMLLMTAPAKFLASPTALLAFAKISTLVLNLLNIVLIRTWFNSWTSETLANLVAGIVGCTLMFYETINGMETPLILTFVMGMLILFPSTGRKSRLLYIGAGALLLLMRWEAAWLMVPFVLAERNLRRNVAPVLSWGLIFIASNVARWLYFGDLLPNTVTAKQHFPYSAPSLRIGLERHITEPFLILYSCKIFLVLLAGYALYRVIVLRLPLFPRKEISTAMQSSWHLRFLLAFVLFSLILSTAIGPNWGPEFRSFYSAWPFLIALLLLPVFSNLAPRALTWITLALCLLTVGRMQARIQPLRSEKAPVYMPNITVDRVGVAAPILTELQQITGTPVLTYAAADMGAVMLFTNNVHVVDLGLLCDRTLAHQGFSAVQPYVLQQRRPDVIEIHEVFTEVTKLDSYPEFLQNYRPVYIHGIRFFLRRSLLDRIPTSRLSERAFLEDGSPQPSEAQAFILSKAPYRYIPADKMLNRHFANYLVLE
ncbi:MAG TPA: hypothetical protein VFS41_01240 [Edaphobacter sp.]|nr:hypothetical protein [Edaphobacter sp.]